MALQAERASAAAEDLPPLEDQYGIQSFENDFPEDEYTFFEDDMPSYMANDEILNSLQSSNFSKFAETIANYKYAPLHSSSMKHFDSFDDILRLRETQYDDFEEFMFFVGMNDTEWRQFEQFLDKIENEKRIEEIQKRKVNPIRDLLQGGVASKNKGEIKILKITNNHLRKQLEDLKAQQQKMIQEQQQPEEEEQQSSSSKVDPKEVEKKRKKHEKKLAKQRKELQKESERKIKNINKKVSSAADDLISHKNQTEELRRRLEDVTAQKGQKASSLTDQISHVLQINEEHASRYSSHLVEWGIRKLDDLTQLNLQSFREIMTGLITNDLKVSQANNQTDFDNFYQCWAAKQRSSSTFQYLNSCMDLEGDLQTYDRALYLHGIELNPQDGTFTTSSQNLGDFFDFADVNENDQEFFQRRHIVSGSSGQVPVTDLSDVEHTILNQDVKEWLLTVGGIKDHYIDVYAHLFGKNNCYTVGDVINLFQNNHEIFSQILKEFMGGYRPIIRQSIRDKIKTLDRASAAKLSSNSATPQHGSHDGSQNNDTSQGNEEQKIEHFLQSLVERGLDSSVIGTYCETFEYYNVDKISDLQQLQPRAQSLVLEGVVSNENHRNLIMMNLPS